MAMMHRLSERLSAPASRYGTLLVVVLINVLLYSILDQHQVIRWLLDLSVLAILAGAMRAMPDRPRGRYLVIGLGLAASITGGIGGSFEIGAVYPVGSVLRGLFLGALVVIILKDISRRKEVTLDVVLGACCVYTLIGMAWAAAYALMNYVDPTSFQFDEHGAAASSGSSDEAALVYFSLITMTTVGYGDLAPIAAPARMLAALEALVAQLFLAIVIARFVAMEITSRHNGREHEG